VRYSGSGGCRQYRRGAVRADWLSEEKSAVVSEKQYPVQVVKYTPPAEPPKLKKAIRLCNTDINFVAVQVVGEGGENNLHSHSSLDGFWFVLEGRARFYGEGDEVIGDIGKYEGVMIPRGTPYWFESVGDVPLQILQVESKAQNTVEKRTDFTPPKASALRFLGHSGTLVTPEE
jgi:mannose-6-phosphate isomerase-like protein (cupin superfamily)